MTVAEILDEVDLIAGGLHVAVERMTDEALRLDAASAVQQLWKLIEQERDPEPIE